MSGLAVFGLKYASLLQFDGARGDDAVRENLRRLYGVGRAPSDTRMRERLDGWPRGCSGRCSAAGVGFAWRDGHCLSSVHGTGRHPSKKVHCGSCCGKRHRDGTTTRCHRMPGAVLVHPDGREVFPPVPIGKADGSAKNDCVAGARKRVAGVRKHGGETAAGAGGSTGAVVVEDGLASNGHIEQLRALDLRFLLGASRPPANRRFVPVRVGRQDAGDATAEFVDGDGTRHRFRWRNGAPRNDANFGTGVDFPGRRGIPPGGRERRFPRVTEQAGRRERPDGAERARRRRAADGSAP